MLPVQRLETIRETPKEKGRKRFQCCPLNLIWEALYGESFVENCYSLRLPATIPAT
jgi:hypothetical protein